MRAYLAENKLWFIVNGTIKEPKSGEEQMSYLEKSAQAAGAMLLACEASQHVHSDGIEMDSTLV